MPQLWIGTLSARQPRGKEDMHKLIGIDSFTCARPQPSSRFIHRKQKISNERDDTDINMETQMWEKPRQSTNCRIHYGRGVQRRGYTEATTSCPLLRHTRRLQLRQ